MTLYWSDNLHVVFQLDHEIGYVALAYFQVFDSGSNVSVDLRPKTTRKAMGGSPGVREDPVGSRRSPVVVQVGSGSRW